MNRMVHLVFRATCVVMIAVSAAHPASAQSSTVGPATTSLTSAQMRDDLAAFRRDFMAVDKSYSAAARSEAESQLRQLEGNLDRATPALFELTLARIVALADNGHTAAYAGPRSRRYNRVGIRLTPFGDDFRVLRAQEALSDLLGARLRSIDGRPLATLRLTTRSLAGGVPRWRDRSANFLLESPEQLHALGLAKDVDRAAYVFELLNGKTVQRMLIGEPGSAGARGGSDRWLYPEPAAGEGDTWRPLVAVATAPWALQSPDSAFRFRSIAEIGAFMIQLRRTSNAVDRPIASFLAEMVERIEREHPQHLIVDVRLNGGGDLNTTRDFLKRLPSLIPGRIFVLTSPWTFSAAISSVGYLKQAAPDRVTIVGEEVGDRLNFFAEGRGTQLPNSGMQIGFATERHDYQTGCRGFTDCHGPVVRNPIAVPTLAPEIAAPWTIAAYTAGRDPGVDAVTRALKK